MANYKVTDAELTVIANAIRTKGGTQAQLEFPTGFVTAIGNIPSGAVLETLSVTENGTYTPGTGKDGFSSVTVNVAGGKHRMDVLFPIPTVTSAASHVTE